MMTSETIRQAALAYLARSPESEWVRYGDLADVILGRPYQQGDYFLPGRDENGERIVGPRTTIDAELHRMKDEGLVVHAAHGGWKLAR